MINWITSIFTKEVVSNLLYYVNIFFVCYLIGYSTFLFASVLVGGNQLYEDQKKRQLQNQIHHDYYVPITIVVPAYNEEVTIVDTLRSLQLLDYRLYEVVVVNDGSKDLTDEVVRKYFNLHQVMRPIRRQLPCQEVESVYEGELKEGIRLTLVNKKNGGKADAINMGINVSRFPYFICMDADSILQKDSLTRIAAPLLESQDIVAVGSMIRVCNDSVFKDGQLVQLRMPKKLVPAFQSLEYERSFLASRILLDKFNANLIISGAFGLFRKDSVIQVGGYRIGSVGEDMELIMKLHSYYRSNHIPYAIKYAYDAICWTQAPERFRDLIKQRKRWHIGLIQSMLKHRLLTKFSYYYYMFYELLSPIIEVFGLLITFLAYLYGLLNVKYMVALYVTYALFGALLTVISYISRNFAGEAKLKLRDVFKALLLCIPENVIIRFVLAWTRLLAILFYRGKKTRWGEIKRYDLRYDEENKKQETEQEQAAV